MRRFILASCLIVTVALLFSGLPRGTGSPPTKANYEKCVQHVGFDQASLKINDLGFENVNYAAVEKQDPVLSDVGYWQNPDQSFWQSPDQLSLWRPERALKTTANPLKLRPLHIDPGKFLDLKYRATPARKDIPTPVSWL